MSEWLILLALLAVALIALAFCIVLRCRPTPDAEERQRRLEVHRSGRMSDGMLTDVIDDVFYYSYSAFGVDYSASQEIGRLAPFLPADLDSFIGPVTVKYSPRNPANSIVICEEWSGLRTRTTEEATT